MAARRSARNSPCAHKAQEGVKGGTLAGGSPFAGGLSRPQPMRAAVGPAVDEGKGRRGRRPLRRVGNGPCAAGFTARSSDAGRGQAERGKVGRNRSSGTSRTPSPTGLLRRHNARGDPAPGRGPAERGRAGGDRSGGTSVTPTPTGRLRVFTLAGMSCTVLVYGVANGRGSIPARTSVCHTPHIEIKKRPSGAFSPFLRRGAPKLQSSAERTPQRPSGTSHASGRGGRVPKPHGGATTPSAFLWGSTPFLWARPKKWGGTRSTNLKSSRTNRRVPPSQNPPPGGLFTFLVLGDAICSKKRAPCGARLVAGRGFEPTDLRVMSPTSYRTAPPRDVESLIIIARSRLSVNTFFIAGSAGGPPCPGTCRRRW